MTLIFRWSLRGKMVRLIKNHHKKYCVIIIIFIYLVVIIISKISKILQKKKKKIKDKKKDRLLIFIKKWRIRYRWTVSLRIWYEERGKKLAKKLGSPESRGRYKSYSICVAFRLLLRNNILHLYPQTTIHFIFILFFAGFADEI